MTLPDLLPELWYHILDHLTQRDLLALSLVSSSLSTICQPHLFRNVTLLLRNYSFPTLGKPGQSNGYALRKSQAAFTRAIARNPHLAHHVRSFQWTLELAKFSGEDYHLIPTFARPSRPTSPAPLGPSQCFTKLVNVRRVHIHIPWETVRCPNVEILFPAVTAVKISGQFSIDIARLILHTPRQLHELSLDHVFQDPVDVSTLFSVLSNSCPSLRKLSLRKEGNAVQGEPFNLEHDAQILRLWGKFVGSCKASLEHATFALTKSTHGCVVYLGEDMRSACFRDHVLPVLWEPGWDRLSTLRLEGIKLKKSWRERLYSASPLLKVELLPSRYTNDVWHQHSADDF
ncbi:hypothetical protein SISNIDRAFT_486087 [Sistotremastrum niveocremeum HHB9708]|uniref:F-box domain-containing protein n=1 Tax=Sistotremastrum niveocremeum HHB9708 TaxID=1314777 RepID=A0A164UEU2_9AGAM|nr:hypothetical protein SISNIDRAFT_486087 [Sistotremastrum niveocremeum HHB9708]